MEGGYSNLRWCPAPALFLAAGLEGSEEGDFSSPRAAAIWPGTLSASFGTALILKQKNASRQG